MKKSVIVFAKVITIVVVVLLAALASQMAYYQEVLNVRPPEKVEFTCFDPTGSNKYGDVEIAIVGSKALQGEIFTSHMWRNNWTFGGSMAGYNGTPAPDGKYIIHIMSFADYPELEDFLREGDWFFFLGFYYPDKAISQEGDYNFPPSIFQLAFISMNQVNCN